MATENNKNLKYQSRDSIKSFRKKLKDTTSINSIKSITRQFLDAVKIKHT
jgi:hypothetical protein